jgi:hypothetical protein
MNDSDRLAAMPLVSRQGAGHSAVDSLDCSVKDATRGIEMMGTQCIRVVG